MTTTTIMANQMVLEKPNLVRRVSDLFRADGKTDGPPSLFSQNSMQKLRHCCQNLNLFPYLLYSFGHPKATMPMMKFNMCLGLFIARLTERIFRVYSSMRQTIICGLGLATISQKTKNSTSKFRDERDDVRLSNKWEKTCLNDDDDDKRTARKFEKITVQKPKNSSLLLKLAVYLAPLVLAFQLVGIFGLMIFGKHTPGFVFLFSALLFLGFITMRVLNQGVASSQSGFKREKRKVE